MPTCLHLHCITQIGRGVCAACAVLVKTEQLTFLKWTHTCTNVRSICEAFICAILQRNNLTTNSISVRNFVNRNTNSDTRLKTEARGLSVNCPIFPHHLCAFAVSLRGFVNRTADVRFILSAPCSRGTGRALGNTRTECN